MNQKQFLVWEWRHRDTESIWKGRGYQQQGNGFKYLTIKSPFFMSNHTYVVLEKQKVRINTGLILPVPPIMYNRGYKPTSHKSTNPGACPKVSFHLSSVFVKHKKLHRRRVTIFSSHGQARYVWSLMPRALWGSSLHCWWYTCLHQLISVIGKPSRPFISPPKDRKWD